MKNISNPKPKLNRTFLRVELARRNKSHAWLARELGFNSRQAFYHYINYPGAIQKIIPRIAERLHVDSNNLIELV